MNNDTETCQHCGRTIVQIDGGWFDPEATGDDAVWSETCDAHDTFVAEHEPEPDTDETLRQFHAWNGTSDIYAAHRIPS